MLLLDGSRNGAGWDELERLICDVQIAHARGMPRIKAIEEAFAQSRIVTFRSVSTKLLSSGEFIDGVRLGAQLKFAHPEVRSAFEIIFPSILIKQDGVCRLDSAAVLLNRFSGFSRLISQHLSQSRAQCLFLVLFIPVISAFFCISRSEQFLGNIFNGSGFLVFMLALILFFSGSFLLLWSLRRTHTLLFNKSIESPSGRAFFVRNLMTSSSLDGGSLDLFALTLEKLGCERLKIVSRSISWGLPFVVGKDAETKLKGVQRDFLQWVLPSYLYTSPESRERWLEKTHDFLFASIQEKIGQRTATLNLQLMLVMAIFFLPALFLMLWLSGTPAGPGTIM